MENTIDSILQAFEGMASMKVPMSPHQWLDGCSKMLALVGGEQDRLFELESAIANNKARLMEDPECTASKAKIMTEASPYFLESRKLKAKIERVFEAIRIGKVMARMSMEEYKSN